MATMVVLASSNLMSSVECCKRLPTLQINKNMTAIGFQGQPLHVGGSITFRQARRRFLVYAVQPGNPPPTGDSLTSWQHWIFGVIATVIIPFFTGKWTKILKFKDEVDNVVEETDKIVEYVEEVAETVDKVAKDVADHLPEGGEWRNAVMFVDGVAKEIAREAHLVDDFLHEVEEVEEEAELLVESLKDQTKNIHKDLNTR